MTPELEQRVCACGCGGTWRCLPSSSQRYASFLCKTAEVERSSGRAAAAEVIARAQRWAVPRKPDGSSTPRSTE